MSQEHRIRKEVWNVKTSSADDAGQWRAYLCNDGREAMLAMLERAFDQSCDDKLLHVPQLTLNLKLDAGDSFLSLWPEVMGQVEKQLSALAMSVASASCSSPPFARSVTESPPGLCGYRAAEASFTATLLMHYLRTGLIPWYVDGDASEVATRLAGTVRNEIPVLIRTIQEGDGDAHFLFRLLQLVSDEGLPHFIDLLAAALPPDIGTAAGEMMKRLLLDRSEPGALHTRLDTASKLFFIARAGHLKEFLPLLPGEAHGSLHAEELFRFFCESRDRETLSAQPAAAERPKNGASDPLEKFAAGEVRPTSVVRADRMVRGVTSTATSETTSDLFPIMVRQGGLVLLHPFVSRLFETLSVTGNGDKEIPEENLPRAAALLHFLATGREEVFEYELPLIKVMLGLHPRIHLPLCAGTLKDRDTEECEALLRATIGHWQALKKTSPEGLRSSFLQRCALLREEEKGWKLQVERKGIDLLLDQLPWSIAIVRLPWMKGPVYVEW